MGCSFNRFGALFKVFEYLLDDCRIFDTGNDPNVTTTLTTGLNVYIENSLQSLRPSHGGLSLFR
jgi:hypothetical protein